MKKFVLFYDKFTFGLVFGVPGHTTILTHPMPGEIKHCQGDWRRGTLRQRDIYCTGRDGTPLVGLTIRTYQRVGRSLTVGDMHHRFMIHIQRNQSRLTMAIVCNAMGNGQWDIMCHHVVLIPVILLSPCILNPLCRPGNLNNPNF